MPGEAGPQDALLNLDRSPVFYALVGTLQSELLLCYTELLAPGTHE